MKIKILQKTFVAPILVLASLMLLLGSALTGGIGSPTILAAQSVPGSYELSFFNDALVSVSSLPACASGGVCEELIPGAHVEEQSSGLPAQGGAVTFQYCSYKGLPPNDITRADEAPTAACESGLATWKDLRQRSKVNESGDALGFFGIVLIPRTVGFRFRYTGQGSGFANGMSLPRDFTWTVP